MTDAFVLGRVGIDLYPNELETPLAEVETFTRFVGGFAGNVSTGLARLGVRTAIVSRVGADGNGDFVRSWLGGGTGDTLGATAKLCETAALVGFVAAA